MLQLISNLFIMAVALAYLGILGKVTLSLGQSAVDLHEKGLMSLQGITKSLTGKP